LRAQPVDQRLADPEGEHHGREDRAAGAEGQVTKQVEHLEFVGQRIEQMIEHSRSYLVTIRWPRAAPARASEDHRSPCPCGCRAIASTTRLRPCRTRA